MMSGHLSLHSLVVQIITLVVSFNYVLFHLLHGNARSVHIGTLLHHLLHNSIPAHPFDLTFHNIQHRHIPIVPPDAIPDNLFVFFPNSYLIVALAIFYSMPPPIHCRLLDVPASVFLRNILCIRHIEVWLSVFPCSKGTQQIFFLLGWQFLLIFSL